MRFRACVRLGKHVRSFLKCVEKGARMLWNALSSPTLRWRLMLAGVLIERNISCLRDDQPVPFQDIAVTSGGLFWLHGTLRDAADWPRFFHLLWACYPLLPCKCWITCYCTRRRFSPVFQAMECCTAFYPPPCVLHVAYSCWGNYHCWQVCGCCFLGGGHTRYPFTACWVTLRKYICLCRLHKPSLEVEQSTVNFYGPHRQQTPVVGCILSTLYQEYWLCVFFFPLQCRCPLT